MVIRVDFLPQASTPPVLGMVIPASTGICYGNQCGGLSCEWKELEGYLVLVGDASRLLRFFERFDGWPPLPPHRDWAAKDLSDLERIVRDEVLYFQDRPDGDVRKYLSLDPARRDDLTEAWIPVRFPGGSGVLVFENSD